MQLHVVWPMSTYLYVWCICHNPPIRSDNESGQHLYDLPQIREDYANRQVITDGVLHRDVWPQDTYGYRSNTARFFAAHPDCVLSLRDEYGRQYPWVDPEKARPPGG